MPTYEYECKKCGYIFDEFQSISAPHLTACPKEECRGEVYRRFSPGAGFIFKGSGFYITDYRSDSYKKRAQADSGSNSNASDTSSGAPSSGTSSSGNSSTNTSSTKT
ncbi:MAG: hypothetical protein LBI42_07875 [Chitinispirillales bacterium]|jgi:putative FmdB family regulatory protein|nr:hypothetical protein [Chitinispirillales bacterium]